MKTLACICESVKDVDNKMDANLTRCCAKHEKMTFADGEIGCDKPNGTAEANVICQGGNSKEMNYLEA